MGVPRIHPNDADLKSEHVGLFAEKDLFGCVSQQHLKRFGTSWRSTDCRDGVFLVQRLDGGPR
jgi:hypothetical protein